ncbi:energy-coupling factor ABC transporter ATP-binding protein [Thalassovita taeanensis]|uniref:Biotin transport system ATP-binding protein n=1 Tax=Thalassovita taeanensis TaxID=657014 RepID=A0A1H9GBT0_9RHOB|nr:ABC transporter ATP-binding protein [Thalassovita taeanensis]SEQ47483.1 biotin transport system ATP-binding protein [Thalassovita taeanensis]
MQSPREFSIQEYGPTACSVVLNDVAYARDGRAVFSGLSLELTQSRVGIVGRNGSGKSQLARLIAGLAAPDAGVLRVGGADVARDRKAALGLVGILFQNPDHQIIFPTVGEELCFGLTAQGANRPHARQRAQAMLDQFERSDWFDRSVHGLSQGQRHLVCLMSVLVMAPKVIVLDEPFAGLDLATTVRLGRYLDGLEQRLIHISHDLPALTEYDRVIWLERGTVQMDGPPQQVLPAYEAEMREQGGRNDFTDL